MDSHDDEMLEMACLRMEGADLPADSFGSESDPNLAGTPYRPDELDRAELGMGDVVRDTTEMHCVTGFFLTDQTIESLDETGRGHRESGVTRSKGLRDVARGLKAEGLEGGQRETFLVSEARSPFIHGDLRERGVGLVSDEEFERDFGSAGSGGSGGSTPKRRSASFRVRGNGVSRMENGVEWSSKEIPLKGGANLSPASRHAKDRGIVFIEEETGMGWPTSPLSNPVILTVTKTLFYVLVWYTFSTCLTLYNKLLLGEKLGNFPAPLLMNTIHFSMQSIISTLVLRFWWGSLSPIRMSPKDYFLRVVPTAAATALDIDLSNISIVFISVSFATMCKSGAPVFLLLFAFAFKLEVPSFKMLGIIVIISLGVMLTVAKETEFELRGFILVMLATVMSGFRWTVTQLLLQKEEYGLNNPFAAMSYLTPVMALITAVFSLALEPWRKLGQTPYFDTSRHVFESCALMLLGGTLAFFMVMAEYLLISETSAVTLIVAGVVKEVLTIVVAVFFFHDPFTVLKGVGLVVIIFGVCLFNWFKYQKLVEGSLGQQYGSTQQEGDRSPLKYAPLWDEATARFDLEDDAQQHNLPLIQGK